MLTVVRVINNNFILGADPGGSESVLMGRGLGFGARAGDAVDPSRVSRAFTSGTGTPDRLAALIAQLPVEDVELATEIVDAAAAEFGRDVADRMLVPFTDHLSFALRRAREQMAITYPLQWEVESLYTREVAFARRALALVTERTGVALPPVEAIPVALHLVNAQFGHDDVGRTMELTTLIRDVMSALDVRHGVGIDVDAPEASRFVTHLRYLLVRQREGAVLEDGLSEMARNLQDGYPAEFASALAVRDILEGHFGSELNQDELVYLTLHIIRLVRRRG
ncbi:PRD domain-containing protein [Georgenia faecalis]|uniref:PRD domain-containing protein n=1 Tax=Georgenia faecalis TaxID=2483799 RepID=UPI000FDBF89E|nr:PRD domain-containing protein [Georgenia faecalis]